MHSLYKCSSRQSIFSDCTLQENQKTKTIDPTEYVESELNILYSHSKWSSWVLCWVLFVCPPQFTLGAFWILSTSAEIGPSLCFNKIFIHQIPSHYMSHGSKLVQSLYFIKLYYYLLSSQVVSAVSIWTSCNVLLPFLLLAFTNILFHTAFLLHSGSFWSHGFKSST